MLSVHEGSRSLRALGAGVVVIAFAMLSSCLPVREDGLDEFDALAPRRNSAAPAFELRTLDGGRLSLEQLTRDRPLVLQLGSLSCPVFRERCDNFAEFYEQYAGRVNFAILYTREAHPRGSPSPYADGEWIGWANHMTRVYVEEPKSVDDRAQLAAKIRETYGVPDAVPILLDEMNNETWSRYGAAPSPVFVIDVEGRVVERQGWGVPESLPSILDALLDRAQGAPGEGGRPVDVTK